MNWNIFSAELTAKRNPLPYAFNSAGYDDGPFIAADETYLIFESDRPTAVKGNLDLYISFRKKDKTWTAPMNMGPAINTPHSERFASVSPDGKYLFFGRNTGNGFDIWWIDAAVIDELKKQAVKNGSL